MFSFFKKKPEIKIIPEPNKKQDFWCWNGGQKIGKSEDDLILSHVDVLQNSILSTASTVQKNALSLVAASEGQSFAMDGVEQGIDSSNLSSVIAANNGAYGQPISPTLTSWYAHQGFIGYQTCAIIAQNWLVDKACRMPANDAVRNGYEITINNGDDVDPKIIDEIRRADLRYGIKKELVEFEQFKRIFGIRIALFIVESDDPDYYLKPFNPDGVKKGSYKGISQIDPYWITPLLDREGSTNPASQNFYEPAWWIINGKRVHRSHLVIAKNGKLADILKPTYLYGGIPVPQKVAERVYAAERTANEAPMLAMTKRVTVFKTDTNKVSADIPKFLQSMENWMALMNNFGVKVLGEDEEITQFDTSLADLDAVIMTQYQIVAAAAEVPATKLLGTSPKGFGASGEYEETSYHEFLSGLQEMDLTPLVERHHLLLMRSEIAPKFGIKPIDTSIKWNPINEMSAEQLADVNLKKAQTDNFYVQMGAVDGMDIRTKIIADAASGYNGLDENYEPDNDTEIEE